jgi:DNA-binding transcriptional LysR family regulator
LLEQANEKVPLRVGMIDSIADLLFVHGDYLQDLERQAHLSLTINNSAQLLELLERDELDMVLIAEPDRIPRTLTITPVGEEPLVLVANAANTELPEAITHKRIGHFLSYNQNSHTHQLVENYFAQQDIQLEPTFYSTSPEIMLQLVLANRGVAVLPYLLVKEHLVSGKLVRAQIGTDGIKRRIVGVHRTGRTLAASSAQILQKTQAELSALYKEASVS